MVIAVSANNGTAPASALSTLPGLNGDGSAHTAPHCTVAGYGRLRSAMTTAGLGDLIPSDGWSCYRDRAAQQHMRDIGLTTIPVGQSIHGEWTYGSAVDFSNLGGFGAPRHNWLRSNAAAFGWYQPGWATAGGSLPEPWHWEYDQRSDPQDGNESLIGEDGFLMALSDQQQTDLFNAVMNLQGWVWKGGPDVDNPTPSQPWPSTLMGRVRNLDLQTLGSEGFSPSVAERVINIEAATVPGTPPISRGHLSRAVWRALVEAKVKTTRAAAEEVADHLWHVLLDEDDDNDDDPGDGHGPS